MKRSELDLRKELRSICKQLVAREKPGTDFSTWPWMRNMPRNDCGNCYTASFYLARRFKGVVVGYPIFMVEALKNPKWIGSDTLGHDFAIIEDFLVDWWGWQYWPTATLYSPVLHLEDDAELISVRYKPMSEWGCYAVNDFRRKRDKLRHTFKPLDH